MKLQLATALALFLAAAVPAAGYGVEDQEAALVLHPPRAGSRQAGRLFDTQRLTAAALLEPPASGWYIYTIRCLGGATWGTYSINYDGTNSAHFIAPSNGTTQIGWAEYAVNHKVQGNSIPAASTAFNGGTSVVEIIYSNMANSSGKTLSAYRAIRAARTDAGATTADITTDFDGGPAQPIGIHVGISASLGRVRFPAVSSSRMTVEAQRRTELGMIHDAPDLASSPDVTLEVITDGAATIQAVVFY